MSYNVKGTTITLTRGDTLRVQVSIFTPDGEIYELQDGDKVRFALKRSISESDPLIVKQIPTDSLILTLDPDDTKPLSFGNYIYDIELTKKNGDVDTFITLAKMVITEEVY